MWSRLNNRFETPVLAVDAVVAISTAMLATVFVFAAVFSPVLSMLMS